MRIMIDGIVVECSIGNITAQQDIAAIVNPASPGLAPGPGVSGVIHAKAGSDLYQECIPYAPLRPGKAVVTSGYLLPNKHVIHCLPPTNKTEQGAQQLEQCYFNALMLADELELHSVAFPSLATGSFGNPPISSAALALGTVRNTARLLRRVRRVHFVLFDRQVFMQYRNLMAANPESVLQSKFIG
jgi:O-acetyl-ADP-ribose deacetylase (regulator of RNase III)